MSYHSRLAADMADDDAERERREYEQSVEDMIDAEQGYTEWKAEQLARGLALEYPTLDDVSPPHAAA